MKKYLIWTLAIIVVVIASYQAYVFLLVPTSSIKPIYLIPENATYIIETEEPIDSWADISSSKMWSHLRGNAYFAELTESANSLDSLIRDNQLFFDLLGSRQVLVSAHMINRFESDFLFIVDLQKASRLTVLKQYLKTVLGDEYQVTRREYHAYEIIEITDKETNDTYYMSFIENLLVVSFTHVLLEQSIDQLEEPVIGRDLNYLQVYKEMKRKSMFRLYFNYKYMDDYIHTFLEEKNEYVDQMSKELFYTGINVDLSDEGTILMKGHTSVNDTLISLLPTMLNAGSGKINITNIAPARTAVYTGLGFKSFSKAFENFEEVYKENDPEGYEEYLSDISKLEKYLDIDLKEDFVSWIKDEMAILQLMPAYKKEENEYALVFKAISGEEAQEKLDYVAKKIRRRTPAKFKSFDYKGHKISFLSIKGLFKAMLGPLVNKLDRPYYTIVDDYVVFSNHPQTLRSIIDDYEEKNTLAEKENFQKFVDNFNTKSNVFVYLQTPVLVESLQGFLEQDAWRDLQKNKDYIVCFSDIGFQLSSERGMFETKIIAQFTDINQVKKEKKIIDDQVLDLMRTGFNWMKNENTLDSLVVQVETVEEEEEEISTEEIIVDNLDAKNQEEFHEDGTLKVEVGLKNGLKHGAYREYYPSGDLKIKGRYKNDQKDGTWRYYDEEGELLEKKKFRNGKES